MLAIRLSRTGKKHQAYFRVVVSDSHRTPTANFVDILGNWDPHTKKLAIDQEKLQTYLKNGAQPSNSMAKILKAEKIDLPKWVKITEKNKAPKKTEEKKEEVKAEAPEAEDGEAPAEEATEEVKTEAEVTEEAPSEKVAEEPKAEEVKEENIKAEEPAKEA